jgi:hypothetical protein
MTESHLVSIRTIWRQMCFLQLGGQYFFQSEFLLEAINMEVDCQEFLFSILFEESLGSDNFAGLATLF